MSETNSPQPTDLDNYAELWCQVVALQAMCMPCALTWPLPDSKRQFSRQMCEDSGWSILVVFCTSTAR